MLQSNQYKLYKKYKALQEELISATSEKETYIEPEEQPSLIEEAIKEKNHIEDQIIKYKLSIESLKTQEENLLGGITRAENIIKIKDIEIKNLNAQVQKLKSSKPVSNNVAVKSNSEKRCGINKNDIKPYPTSSFSIGISAPSQKSTTLESSRSSH